jgi:hypothetical protein
MQTVWIFRVFLEMSTRQIAAHPEIAMKPGAVDVALARTRDKVRVCMKRRGFDPRDMPPGTFAVLWAEFRLGRRRGKHDR